jgi:mono/diheme cytochrome c family protein
MRTISRITLLAVLLSVSACRSRQLREWTARDHDPDGGPAATGPVARDDDPLSAGRALFAAQCASCHGNEGRGDGPMAAMFRPADLSDPTLQSARSDEDLANAITRGKGRMPSFGAQLRPEAVPLLVRLIRSWRR